MPIIRYPIQKSVAKTVHGRTRWFCKYEYILVDVKDEVAEFLALDNKQAKRYKWKIEKQMQDAKIYTQVYLDDFAVSKDGSKLDFPVAETIEDTVHSYGRDPLEIIMEDKVEKGRAEFAELMSKMYAFVLTKKQYEVWKLNEDGYRPSDIARLLNIDESSVRERLRNAQKRISQIAKQAEK